jgi:hypothetical protein
VEGTDRLAPLGSTAPLGTADRLSLVAAGFRGPDVGAADLAVIDRSGRVVLVDRTAQPLPGWPFNLPAPLIGHAAAGDLDGDGLAELVLADTLGFVHALDGDGREMLGFPKPLGARATAGAMLVELDDRPGAEILLMTEDGSLHALGADGRAAAGFPLAMGGRRIAAPYLDDMNADGRLDLAAGSPDHVLLATGLDLRLPDSLIAWAGEENGPGRSAWLRPSTAGTGDPDRLQSKAGEFVCFPNPARGSRLTVRFFLEPSQRARVDIFDMLGRPVAEGLAPPAGTTAGEASVDWDLTDVAPGTYLVRLDLGGGERPSVRFKPVAVLR